MSWLISIVLASSLFTTGNIPVGDKYLNENRTSESINVLDETERFEQSYPLNPGGKISVSNINGSITIEAWERNEVKLEATKIADSRETLAEVEVRINSRPDRLEVETDYGNWNRRGNQKWDNYKRKIEIQYRLTVPQTAVLDEIETVNGSVSLKDLSNYVKASAVNGAVSGVNLGGTAELSTVNGTVTGDFDRLQSGSLISLSTVNGSANLIIPSDANATVRAETVNGTIDNEFGLPVRKGKYVGRDLYGRIGSGDVKIKLESVNGGLSVKRKNDGKSPNPATDLLPPKSADDTDDFDRGFDGDFEASMRDARRALERNMEISRRVIEKAMTAPGKEAVEAIAANREMTEAMVAEIKKIEPQLAKIDAEALRKAAAAIEADKQAASEALARLADMKGLKTPFLEEKSGTFQVRGIPSVRIEARNCAVSIHGSDQPEVRYAMSRVASNSYHLPIEFRAGQKDPATVEIKVINNNEWTGSNGNKAAPTQVRLEVFVPKKSNLRIATNDEIRLEGVSGDIELEGGDGAINIRDAAGRLNLKAADGLVRVIGFKGVFESETADGEMFLEGDFEKICARLNDGTVVLTLPEKADALVTANTGAVVGEGVELIRRTKDPEDPETQWQIGRGGRDFNFNLADGKVIIRRLSDLKTS